MWPAPPILLHRILPSHINPLQAWHSIILRFHLGEMTFLRYFDRWLRCHSFQCPSLSFLSFQRLHLIITLEQMKIINGSTIIQITIAHLRYLKMIVWRLHMNKHRICSSVPIMINVGQIVYRHRRRLKHRESHRFVTMTVMLRLKTTFSFSIYLSDQQIALGHSRAMRQNRFCARDYRLHWTDYQFLLMKPDLMCTRMDSTRCVNSWWTNSRQASCWQWQIYSINTFPY